MTHECRKFIYDNKMLKCVECGALPDHPVLAHEVVTERPVIEPEIINEEPEIINEEPEIINEEPGFNKEPEKKRRIFPKGTKKTGRKKGR